VQAEVREREQAHLKQQGKRSQAMDARERAAQKGGRYRYQLAKPIQTLVASVSAAFSQLGVAMQKTLLPVPSSASASSASTSPSSSSQSQSSHARSTASASASSASSSSADQKLTLEERKKKAKVEQQARRKQIQKYMLWLSVIVMCFLLLTTVLVAIF